MKKMWILFAILVLAVFAGGGFLIFGGDILSGDNDIGFSRQDSYFNDKGVSLDDVDIDVVGEAEVIFNQGGVGESSNGGSGGNLGSKTFICTRSQPLQYSLGNFVNNFECIEGENLSCSRVSAECGSGLYNLDYEAEGNFNVRYSLTYSEDVLDYGVDGGTVGSRSAEKFGVEFEKEGSFNIENLGCLIDMESVGEKCLEGYWA